MSTPVKGDGRSRRWQAHRTARRAEFVEAAVRAVEAVGPDASIADIAREAGVSKPVLYRYFADKAELHAEVGRWGAELVLDRVVTAVLAPATARARIDAGVAAYLDTIAEHPQTFLLLSTQHAGSADPLADGKQRAATKLARIIGSGLRQLGVDSAGAEPWAFGMVGMAVSVGQWWLDRRTMSRAAVADYLSGFIWHALSGAADEYGVPLSALDPPDNVRPLDPGREA